MEPALVRLPTPTPDSLCIGTARFDRGLDVIATLDLKGRVLTAERRSTVLRLFQLIGEAVVSDDQRPTLKITGHQTS